MIHSIPGRVEAEGFYFQSGIQLENTSDVGGGKNIGFLDIRDYLDYFIEVAEDGVYNVAYRTAALSEMGQIDLQIIEEDGIAETLHRVRFPATGDWQNWTTTSAIVSLKAGQHQMRILISDDLFNLNYLDFNILTSTSELEKEPIKIYPNPSDGIFLVDYIITPEDKIEVFDMMGQTLPLRTWSSDQGTTKIDLNGLPAGIYILQIRNNKTKTRMALLTKL